MTTSRNFSRAGSWLSRSRTSASRRLADSTRRTGPRIALDSTLTTHATNRPQTRSNTMSTTDHTTDVPVEEAVYVKDRPLLNLLRSVAIGVYLTIAAYIVVS